MGYEPNDTQKQIQTWDAAAASEAVTLKEI